MADIKRTTGIPESARVRITFRETDRFLKMGESSFWLYLRKHLRQAEANFETDQDMERRVQKRFGIVVRNLLVTDFKSGRRYENARLPPEFSQREVDRTTTPMFALEVVGDISYGSMGFDVVIAGVKGFLDFFDSNPELFRVAFAQYCPIALAVLATGYTYAEIDGMSCAIEPGGELRDAFAGSTSSGVTPPDASADQGLLSRLRRSDSINRLWLISNASLLIPVALALAILYVAFQGLEKDRQDFHNGVVTLQERQTEVIRLLVTQKEAADKVAAEKATSTHNAGAEQKPK